MEINIEKLSMSIDKREIFFRTKTNTLNSLNIKLSK